MTAPVPLAVRVSGSGPDLALIHGWGLSGRIFDPVVERLASRFRVHVIDLPGYGDNRDVAVADTTGKADRPAIAAIADAVMASLPDRVALCGWSLGAHIAVAALARHSKQVDRLILCAATPCFVQNADWPHGVPAHLLGSFESLLKLGPKNLLQRFATLINQPDQAARQLIRQSTEVAALTLPTTSALQSGLQLLKSLDWRPLQAKILHPVLLLHGDLDPLMPLAGAEAMQRAFPAARLEVFAGSAHTPFLSQPDRFVALLAEFAQLAQPAPVEILPA